VAETSLTPLHGSLSVVALPQYDRGEAPAATELHFVRVVLQRSPQQEAALEKFMAEQIDPNSPNYHHWLNQDQFNKLYGLADSDVAAIVAWLQSHGLKVETISSTNIAFSGAVGQIEEALHTSIHSFLSPGGRQYFSNTSEPRIPAALSQVVGGVAFLNTLPPRSHAVRGPGGMYDSNAHKFVPVNSSEVAAHPDLTTGSSGNQTLWVVPADAATIYDTPNSYNANFSSGTSYTGQGVTIGIGGDALIQTSTVASYRKRFLNGDTEVPTIINVSGSATAGSDTDEAYLDNEIAGGLAPGAAIRFYTASENDGGIETAVDAMLAENPTMVSVFSLSFGECELYLTTSDNFMINQWWQNAAVKGIAVTVSTGDSGSAGCDNPDQASAAALGLSVSGFSSTPYNIAVGGTDFYPLITGSFASYVNSNQTSANSYRSALSYIPESPWNDSSLTLPPGQITGNIPTTSNGGATNIIAGTGGKSTCSTNTTTFNQNTGQMITGTCTSGYAKPSWQRGPGVPNDGDRDVPDVSLLAANGFYGAVWLVCTDDPEQGTSTDNCATQSNSDFYWAGVGGTSASAPAFAGILALLTEKAGGPIGMTGAKFLYDLYNGIGANAFNDVTIGNNSVVCTSGTPDCQAIGSSFFLKGYNATAGYDLATGLGSVDATVLISAYGSSAGTATATVNATPTPSSVTTAQALSVLVTVSGSQGTPSGTVTVSGGGYTSSFEQLTGGSYTFTIPAGSLAVGADTLTVNYSGDSNYAQASGSAQVTVANPPGLLTPTVTVVLSSASIDSSQPLGVTVMVSGGSGNPTPTGTVAASSGSYNTTLTLTNGSAAVTIPPYTLGGSGTYSVTANYNGDGNYTTAGGYADFLITPTTFSVTASPPPPISPGGSATSTITVATESAYSGTISLVCALTSSPSGATDLPTCSVTSGNPVTLSSTTTSAAATVTVTTTAASSSSLDKRGLPGWLGAGGVTVLAVLIFLGIPARRRSWRNLLGLFVMMAVLGAVSGCGGGGGNGGGGGGGGGGNPGTTAGNYTFTVTGTGNPGASGPETPTFTVTVN
jgi:hypothetical protein